MQSLCTGRYKKRQKKHIAFLGKMKENKNKTYKEFGQAFSYTFLYVACICYLKEERNENTGIIKKKN